MSGCGSTLTSDDRGSIAREYEYRHDISTHVATEHPAGIVDRKGTEGKDVTTRTFERSLGLRGLSFGYVLVCTIL